MTVLRDLLDAPDLHQIESRDPSALVELALTPAPAAPRDTRRRDMAGKPIDPEARPVDMAGVPFRKVSEAGSLHAAATRTGAETRGLGGWYVTGLVTLVVIVGGLNAAIRSHAHAEASPTTATSAP